MDKKSYIFTFVTCDNCCGWGFFLENIRGTDFWARVDAAESEEDLQALVYEYI